MGVLFDYLFRLTPILSNDNYFFLFLLGFYLQLDRRFQDMNVIHLARRLMVKTLNLFSMEYWNEKVCFLILSLIDKISIYSSEIY